MIKHFVAYIPREDSKGGSILGIQVSENTLRIRDIAGRGESTSYLKFTVELPASKPAISRVLSVLGRPKVTSVTVETGKVLFQGVLSLDLLYVPVNTGELALDLIEKVEFKDVADFEYFIDVSDAKPGDEPILRTFLANIDYEVEKEQRLLIDASLRHEVLVMCTKRLKFLGDILITPPEKIKIEKRELLLEEYAGKIGKSVNISGNIALPLGVLRLVDVAVKPQIKRELGDGSGITILGSIDLNLLVVRELGDTAVVQSVYLPGAVAFEERLENLMGDNILSRSKISIDYVSYARIEDELRLDVGLNIQSELTAPKRVGLISEAESVAGRRIVTRNGTLSIRRKVVSAPAKTNAEALLRLPEGLPEPVEMLRVQVIPRIEHTEWAHDTLYAAGSCSLEIIYTGIDGELHSVYWDDVLEFNAPIDFTGLEVDAEVIGIEVNTESFRHQITESGLEISASLLLLAEVSAPEALNCLIEAMVYDEIEEEPAYITFITAEDDDSLWKLSQKYQIPLESILEDNGLKTEELIPGQRVILRKQKKQV